MYQLISNRVPLPEQGQALGQMGTDMPPNRFPEFVRWMFPLIGTDDRVEHDTLAGRWGCRRRYLPVPPGSSSRPWRRLAQARRPDPRARRDLIQSILCRWQIRRPRTGTRSISPGTLSRPQEWRPHATGTMLIVDPSNAGQVGAWDGSEGAFWTAQAQRFDETLEHSYRPFLATAAIRTDDRVLDVGCGTGQATRDVARIAVDGSALGVDLSSQMLALARDAAVEKVSTMSSFDTLTHRSIPSAIASSTLPSHGWVRCSLATP